LVRELPNVKDKGEFLRIGTLHQKNLRRARGAHRPLAGEVADLCWGDLRRACGRELFQHETTEMAHWNLSLELRILPSPDVDVMPHPPTSIGGFALTARKSSFRGGMKKISFLCETLRIG